MTDIQISCFLTAAECENFSKAAEKLYITQPVLGRHIANLEAEIGAPLFIRERKAVHLTACGRIMADYFRKAEAEYQIALSRVRAQQRSENHELVLGTVEGQQIGEVYAAAFKYMMLHYSAVNIKVRFFSAKEIVNALADGVIDVAFIEEVDAKRRADVLDYQYLMKVVMGLVVPKGHPALKKEPINLEDFKYDTFIRLGKIESDIDAERQMTMEKRIGTKHVEAVEDLSTLLLMLESGMGITSINSSHSICRSQSFSFVPVDTGYESFETAAWRKDCDNPGIPMLLQSLKKAGFFIEKE